MACTQENSFASENETCSIKEKCWLGKLQKSFFLLQNYAKFALQWDTEMDFDVSKPMSFRLIFS